MDNSKPVVKPESERNPAAVALGKLRRQPDDQVSAHALYMREYRRRKAESQAKKG